MSSQGLWLHCASRNSSSNPANTVPTSFISNSVWLYLPKSRYSHPCTAACMQLLLLEKLKTRGFVISKLDVRGCL